MSVSYSTHKGKMGVPIYAHDYVSGLVSLIYLKLLAVLINITRY